MDNSGDSLDLLARLAELQVAFGATIPLVAASTPVPRCAPWTVGDLVEHLASIHHWAAAMARSEDDRPLPATKDLRSRYQECAAELGQTLSRLDRRHRRAP